MLSAITALTAVLKDLPAEKIQLNTVSLPPAEAFARPLEREQMERIAARIGNRTEIIGHFAGKVYGHGSQQDIEREIVTLLGRCPCTLTEIAFLTCSIVNKSSPGAKINTDNFAC